MIGLFDSGLGGLTVVARVREELPDADLVFFADQAHVPYGNRSQENLLQLLRDNLAWLDAQHPDAIVLACNTSCAIADLFGWPKTDAPIFDLIESAVLAVEGGGYRRVGVVATQATVRSGVYGRRLRALSGVESFEVAAPALVPLVEAGRTQGEEVAAAVRDVCAQLPGDLDAVVLACTHYPVLDAHFAQALGAGVARVDPAVMHAQRVAAFFAERAGARENGRTRYVTNGDVEAFTERVVRIMGAARTECSAS